MLGAPGEDGDDVTVRLSIYIYISGELRCVVRGYSRRLIVRFKESQELGRKFNQLERLLLVARLKGDIEGILRRHV